MTNDHNYSQNNEISFDDFNKCIEEIHNQYINNKITRNENNFDTDSDYDEIIYIIDEIHNDNEKISEYIDILTSFMIGNNISEIVKIIIDKLNNTPIFETLLNQLSSKSNISMITKAILLYKDRHVILRLINENKLKHFIDQIICMYRDILPTEIIELANLGILNNVNMENLFIDACGKSNIEYVKCLIENKFVDNNCILNGLRVCNKQNNELVDILINAIPIINTEEVLLDCINQCINQDNTLGVNIIIEHIVNNNIDVNYRYTTEKYINGQTFINDIQKLCDNMNDDNFALFTEKLNNHTPNDITYKYLFICAKKCIIRQHIECLKYILSYRDIRSHKSFDTKISDLQFEASLCDSIDIDEYLNSFI